MKWISVKDKPESAYAGLPKGTPALMYGHDKYDETEKRYGYGQWEPAKENRHTGRFYGLYANTHFTPTTIAVLDNNVSPQETT